MLRLLLFVSAVLACDAHVHIFRGASKHDRLVVDAGKPVDNFPVKHRSSFLERVMQKPKKGGSLFGGVLAGCLLWLICPICIWNNERISVKQAKMRLKAEKYAVHITDPEREPLKELNGRIVYITGESTCSETLVDDQFVNVQAEGKIKLRRVVEMYQWIETEHQEEEGNERRIVYEYRKDWRDCHEEIKGEMDKRNEPMPIPSSRRQEPYRASVISGNGDDCVAADRRNVKLGTYYLSDYVVRELAAWMDKDLSADMLTHKQIMGGQKPQRGDDGWWYFGSTCEHELGNIRVKFEELNTGPITVCGVLVHCKKGWTFVPIISKDAHGAGDSIVAECGGNCCSFGVEELKFADPELDEKLVQALEERRKEIADEILESFETADTTKIPAHNPEDDLDDLCCTGPFSILILKLMHFIGLEDELLAVQEQNLGLDQTINAEAKDMQGKVNNLRIASLLGLMLGTYLIISPALKLLNYNIWVSMLGGALLSCMICCCGMLCSCACQLTIMSTAWLVYRPFMGLLGLALAAILAVASVALISEGQKELHKYSPQGQALTFLALNTSVDLIRHGIGW